MRRLILALLLTCPMLALTNPSIATTWIPFGNPNFSYEKDSIIDGDYGPKVWVKFVFTLDQAFLSPVTGITFPRGTSYETLVQYKINCKGRQYTEVSSLSMYINGNMQAQWVDPTVVDVEPGSVFEGLLPLVCKKSWQFWK